MKYINTWNNYKINETESTESHILDLFTDDRLKSYDINDNFHLNISRTKGSFKVNIIDKKTNKVVGRIYIQEIKPNGKGGYKAELRRLHVNDEYRGQRLGEILLKTAMNSFPDIDLYAYPSPNRNKDMDETNVEDYRNRLISFYDKIGLKKPSDKSNKVERLAESTNKFVNVEYKIIIRDIKDNPELLVTDFEIVTHEDKKLKIKAKGYINSYLNGYNDGKKRKGWVKFDDFDDDRTRIVWNKNFENGTKRIKVYQ